jgi:hypothetical protein
MQANYGLLVIMQKKVPRHPFSPPRYGTPFYNGKQGFSWTKIHISLEGWNKNMIPCLLDSPFFILSIVFEPLLWKKSPFDLMLESPGSVFCTLHFNFLGLKRILKFGSERFPK